MENQNIIILDLETTGFSHTQNDIIEIAAMQVNLKTGTVIGTFEHLIKINTYVPRAITQLTGITTTMLLRDGLPLRFVLQRLATFCADRPIYAHNAAFDKRFLRSAFQRYKIAYCQTAWIDTIAIFKKRLPKMINYRLATLINHFQLGSESHRALSDVIHTFQILKIAQQQ